jgi:hypothetical protein
LNYFLRISDKMPTGNLIVHRKVLKDIPNHDFWRNADVPLCNVRNTLIDQIHSLR